MIELLNNAARAPLTHPVSVASVTPSRWPWIVALVMMSSTAVSWAQPADSDAAASADADALAADDAGSVTCSADGCTDEDGTVLSIRSDGERRPRSTGATPEALRDNRRVDIALPQDGPVSNKSASATGRFTINLPDGGRIWTIEDPAKLEPVLNVSTAQMLPVDDGRLARPAQFSVYTNYAEFIDRMELEIYDGRDGDLAVPLATLPLVVGNVRDVEWNGSLPDDERLREGDELIYVLRAYDAEGRFDETHPRRVALLAPEDYQRSLDRLRDSVRGEAQATLTGEALQTELIENGVYGEDNLRQQNIPLYGSRIRVLGQDIPEGYDVRIDGEAYPVDLDRELAAEFLLPVGTHTFDLELSRRDGGSDIRYPMTVEVTGEYLFLVALADITASDNSVGGNIEPLALGDDYDDFLVDGRLAFYLKGKVKGKYLITAQADTQEREIDELFSDFLDERPSDIFRRLDPDRYYPVYGDDSTTWRDVDSMGNLYVRVDWDKSQALWGNYETGVTGTELSQYSRSLYGAALAWRGTATTSLGEPKSALRVFGSEAQTALGHSEFLGTGGSVYYLRHTDILPRSDKAVLEVRDPTTGRVEGRTPLVSGVDYEIDDLQGRLILSRPLSQFTRTNMPTIIRDRPLDGFVHRLIVDYEYIPAGTSGDDVTAGVRGKRWFGDHVGVGLTYIDENRGGDDYTLAGGDLTLQAGRGTYLKLEYAETESTQASVFYSDNGGLTFTQINPADDAAREGDATSVEARANLRELGWSSRDWTVGAWWRELGAGYSSVYRDPGDELEEQGVELSGELTSNLRLGGRASEMTRGSESLEQLQMLLDWDINWSNRLTGEIRDVRETRTVGEANGLLAAVQYTRRLSDSIDIYGVGQVTADDDDGRYEENDAFTVGVRHLFGQRSTVGIERTWGDRGDGTSIDVNYQRTADHGLYGRYTWSTDTTERLFGNRGTEPAGLTVGQRWRLSNQVSLYNESQRLKEGADTGLAHTYGMDFLIGEGWNLGFTVQNGELEATAGTVDREAVSLGGGYRSRASEWASRIEYREDSGAEIREQWATTHRLMHKINESWRVAARINHADTEDLLNPEADARFTEANVGFAWRPWDNDRWALLGRYTYLYDLRPLGQDDSGVDQRSRILALEGIHRLNERWELVGKLARREGEVRTGRGSGEWFDSTADFAAVQARYRLVSKWDVLAEHRWLDVDTADSTRKGWLVGVDRRVNDFFRVGVGYNFTDFSDRLTEQEYDQHGWFLNLVGSY